MALEIPKIINPDSNPRNMIEEVSRQKVSACFQCGKCTNGCPITFAMDIMPHQLIHLLQFGQIDQILSSDAMWVCASCETCTTRCPNGIDIAHVMDSLRQISNQRDIKPDQYSIPIFHKAFLASIKRHGRVHETEMALTYSIEDAGWLGFLKLTGLGFAMFIKGKAKIRPSRVRALKLVKGLFKKAEGEV